VDGDIDAGRVTAQRFVDGIVDNLVHQVMEAHFAGRADVHSRAQPDCGQALEDRNVFSGVAAFFDRWDVF
jgi:hypothetical protein